MDENRWTTGTFNLAVKRTRPETPIEDDRAPTPWEGLASVTSDDVRDFSHHLESGPSVRWTETSRTSEESSSQEQKSGTRMRTGCIPCLMKGQKCDPNDPDCKKAMSSDWSINYDESEDQPALDPYLQSQSNSLTVFRPDTKWRRSWRERHSLNFFVNFSAPQMAGFFDSEFWTRMVIQTSYYEPAILHAIIALGSLHESILQRAFADDKRRADSLGWALAQCNKSIAELTNSQAHASGLDFMGRSKNTPNSRLALTTCILFTAFESLQGRCDSAVSHALQGRRLLQATDRPRTTSMTTAEEDDLEHMRPIVERLEVQATALLDKGRRPEMESAYRSPQMPTVEYPYSLDHAHNMLHGALNSVMRFMQGFDPTSSRDHIAFTMQEKYMHYVPWFAKWEDAFTAYLAANRDAMTSMDVKRAMVLKANHLVGTMLASVDQAAGPVAYDAYEAEFRAIVDLSREVLASFSCPPLPTLTGGSSGTPYLSFSLWVTDPLWMAISRCRNPSIRQAAFSLLSQNPRQEGIWHAGPMLSTNKLAKKSEGTAESGKKKTGKDLAPSKRKRVAPLNRTVSASRMQSARQSETPEISGSRARAASSSTEKSGRPLEECETRIKDEWRDMVERVEAYDASMREHAPPERYKSHCQGRCGIPYLEDLQTAEE